MIPTAVLGIEETEGKEEADDNQNRDGQHL
jgi:hypothetical protein